MSILKLKRKSLNSIVYNSTLMKLPNNLCQLFLGSLFSWVIFIPSITGHIQNLIVRPNNKCKAWYHSLINLFILLIGAVIVKQHDPYLHTSIWIVYLYGLMITFFCVSVLIVIIYVCVKIGDIFEKIQDKRHYTKRKPNIIKEFIKAKKEKLCPMIEWED